MVMVCVMVSNRIKSINFSMFIKKSFFLQLLTCCLLVCTAGCGLKESPSSKVSAQSGIIDLNGWNFSEKGPVRLSGEWEFYRNRFILPGNFNNSGNAGYASLPGVWTHPAPGNAPLPGTGYATYRLKILLASPPQGLALRFYTVSTAFRMFANGKEIASAGRIGRNEHDSIPSYRPQIVHLPNNATCVELVLMVSNFHYRTGGPWRDIVLGPERMLHRERQVTMAGVMFLVGALLIMGVYHLVLYIFRRREIQYIYFSIICFLIAVRALSSGEYVMMFLFPELNFEVLIKFEYLSFYLALPAFAVFIRALFADEFAGIAIKIIVAVSGIFSLAVLAMPARLYTSGVFVYYAYANAAGMYLVFVLLLAAKRKRPGAAVFLMGAVVMLAAMINDNLYSSFIVKTGNFVGIGMLFFIFMQAVALSMRLTGAFSMVEYLSAQLQGLNIDLERQVEERTGELQKAYNTIKELSVRDTLTGSFNRRYLEEELPNELLRVKRYKRSISVILCDIDHFKKINDTYGHLAGDRCLVEFVNNLTLLLRNGIDWVGRYGGEEFLVVLPETVPVEAVKVAERIRQQTEELSVTSEGVHITFTVSCGVAGFSELEVPGEIDMKELFAVVDRFLYQAKLQGRNRIVSGPVVK